MLDTGPLVTYLGWLYFDSIDADKPTRNAALKDIRSGSIWDENKQERFDQFLRNAARRLTTNHVAVEVLNFREHSFLKRHESQFRKFVLERFSFLEEVAVLIKDLDQELVIQFGPTDAGLIWIAREVQGELITSDNRLFRALSSDLYKITLLDHFVDSGLEA